MYLNRYLEIGTYIIKIVRVIGLNTKLIMSADPGKENFSIAVQKLEDEFPSIIYVELLDCTITELRENAKPPFIDQMNAFSTYISKILDEYKPVEVTMERFQMRFRTPGATAEVVNVMIGIACLLCLQRNIPVKLVIAGEWKNHFNRYSDIPLNDLYKSVKRLPPHVIDSAMIGLYYSMKNNDFYKKEKLISYCEKLKVKYDESIKEKRVQRASSNELPEVKGKSKSAGPKK